MDIEIVENELIDVHSNVIVKIKYSNTTYINLMRTNKCPVTDNCNYNAARMEAPFDGLPCTYY